MSDNSLAWALVIATYKRGHILPRCLRLAAKQTRPPSEVVVVDASPDWDKTRDLMVEEFRTVHPEIPITYVQANLPSSTAQRNQGVALASADVLFLIDDDSLMYPDCAEAVMQVYEADVDRCIQGVSAVSVPTPPDVDPGEAVQQAGAIAVPPKQTVLRRLVKSVLATDKTYFLPYDRAWPDRPIPEQIPAHTIGRSQVMVGYAMTFRREILLKEKFSEVLQRYAAGEDQDLSYRVSRQGALVNAVNARLCHLEISGGRLSLFTVTVLAALNPAVLHQFHSSDLRYTNGEWRKILFQRLMIGTLKDLTEKRWQLPRMRGVIFAMLRLRKIYSKPHDELLQWYPQFQAQLIAKNR
jgi:GT2 family glycosyltransferase